MEALMIDVVQDIETLESALIGIEEGASDEKRCAMESLRRMLKTKRKVLREFESQAPGHQFEMEFLYDDE
tara:strand:- start:74 stop:283 length:210 start_codon:yes stop_codon:yes gene_type:complete